MGGEEGKYFLRTSCLLRPLSAPQKAELGIDCLLCRGREIGGVRLGARLVDVYVDLDSPPSKPSSPIFLLAVLGEIRIVRISLSIYHFLF